MPSATGDRQQLKQQKEIVARENRWTGNDPDGARNAARSSSRLQQQAEATGAGAAGSALDSVEVCAVAAVVAGSGPCVTAARCWMALRLPLAELAVVALRP